MELRRENAGQTHVTAQVFRCARQAARFVRRKIAISGQQLIEKQAAAPADRAYPHFPVSHMHETRQKSAMSFIKTSADDNARSSQVIAVKQIARQMGRLEEMAVRAADAVECSIFLHDLAAGKE